MLYSNLGLMGNRKGQMSAVAWAVTHGGDMSMDKFSFLSVVRLTNPSSKFAHGRKPRRC